MVDIDRQNNSPRTARFKKLLGRPVLRNIATVASGTAAAQIITILFTPVITRLYGPETIGLQGIFISLAMLFSTIAALSYPTAIVLPRHDADAIGIVRLSVSLALVTSGLTFLALIFMDTSLLGLINAEKLGSLLYLIPLAMLFSSFSAILSQWLIRKHAYGISARYQVLTSAIVNITKTGVGLFSPSALALILTNLLAGFFGTALTLLAWLKSTTTKRHEAQKTRTKSTVQLAKEYRDFALFRTPQNLINAFSHSLPIILIGAYFGAAEAGQYTIAAGVLAIPAALIGSSVMSVFYPRITTAIHNGENARKLIITATAGMAATGAIPYLAAILLGPTIFPFVFGTEWSSSGIYAQWLAGWLFFQYINKPAVAAIPALGIQKGLLVYELFSTGSKILALWIGFSLFNNAIISVAIFSLSGIAAYIWLITWVILKSPTSSQNAQDKAAE